MIALTSQFQIWRKQFRALQTKMQYQLKHLMAVTAVIAIVLALSMLGFGGIALAVYFISVCAGYLLHRRNRETGHSPQALKLRYHLIIWFVISLAILLNQFAVGLDGFWGRPATWILTFSVVPLVLTLQICKWNQPEEANTELRLLQIAYPWGVLIMHLNALCNGH